MGQVLCYTPVFDSFKKEKMAIPLILREGVAIFSFVTICAIFSLTSVLIVLFL